MQRITALALGLVASVALVGLGAWAHGNPPQLLGRLEPARAIAEDPTGPLARVAIHYAPAADARLLGIWRQLFAVLPARVEVDVEVAAATDYARFMTALREGDVPNRARFHPVIAAQSGARRVAADATDLAPLDARTIAVGDVHLALALLGKAAAHDDATAQALRFDLAAERLAAKGFRVVRVPALAQVSYTSALFDRDRDGTRLVYLPTYGLPVLDDAAQKLYESEGFVVHAIDVVALDGSFGALVDVIARG